MFGLHRLDIDKTMTIDHQHLAGLLDLSALLLWNQRPLDL
jgi:hypothetical protein